MTRAGALTRKGLLPGLAVLALSLLISEAARGNEDVNRVNAALQSAADEAGRPLDFSGIQCVRFDADPPAVTVLLDLPPAVRDRFNERISDALVSRVVGALSSRPELLDFDVQALDADGRAVRLSDLLESAEPDPSGLNAQPPAAPATASASGQPPIFGQGRPIGPLTGKTVYLSPGHGWYYYTSETWSAWLTQRGNTYSLVEDFENNETVSQYLVRYLENAGADVWTCRDRCFSTVEVIVDNATGPYSETGTWFDTSGWNGGGRYAVTSATETATATFTPDMPADGHFPLYLYFVIGSNRAPDALVKIHHTGGTTEVRINQQLTRSNWRYVGTFYWFAGSGQSVTISNQSDFPDRAVIADAIRIGGGIGDQPPNDGGPPSGKRRADECSVYWARYQGASSSVYNSTSYGDGTDDVTCRPRYAEWENETGEDAVYVSLHSNGYNGTLRGTETYMYLDGTPTGSSTLRNYVHTELVGDLRAEWDPTWVDRGQKTADLGEVRLLDTIPGCLTEVGFHDNPNEADDLLEPAFRRIAARAIYQGIAKYFGGSDVPLLPEPPTHARARSNGSTTTVEVTWRPPPAGGAGGHPPAKYKVYRSPNGYAFDNGTETTDTSLTLAGLAPDTVYYFRVTALNDGGESFPTPVLACRTPAEPGGSVPVLIVDGYDALDRSMNIPVYESSSLGTVQRQFLDRRMNSYDYLIEHAAALAGTVLSPAFDSAVNEAVADGDLTLGGYEMVDWFVGRESLATETFSTVEQAAISTYLTRGGDVFVTGMDLAWDLDANGSVGDRSFLNNTLKTAYVSNDVGVYAAGGAADSIFDGLGTIDFDDGTRGTYDVTSPDGVTPLGGGSEALVYSGGSTAAVQYADRGSVVLMSFPFETVYQAAQRVALMDRVLSFFDIGGPQWVYGDFDLDSDVDQTDFGHLQACLTGPAGDVTDPACLDAKYDGDNDIDTVEVSAFRACLSGANLQADLTCDD